MRGFFTLFLFLPLALLLAGALTYQLWYKQLVNLPNSAELEQLVQTKTLPIVEELAKRKIELPARRNLSKLELISARAEAHSSLSSTTLLRVSLINRAEINQPLPWMELSLTSAEGRLVARRQLSPQDYLFDKALDRIGPRELKKITIELLAFPEQAAGYELKLLNK